MIKFHMLYPEKEVVFEEVRSVTVPAYSGEMTFLPGHAELFTLLRAGVVIVRFAQSARFPNIRTDKTRRITITEGGGCRMFQDTVTIVV